MALSQTVDHGYMFLRVVSILVYSFVPQLSRAVGSDYKPCAASLGPPAKRLYKLRIRGRYRRRSITKRRNSWITFIYTFQVRIYVFKGD
jgi:hypothetical protein